LNRAARMGELIREARSPGVSGDRQPYRRRVTPALAHPTYRSRAISRPYEKTTIRLSEVREVPVRTYDLGAPRVGRERTRRKFVRCSLNCVGWVIPLPPQSSICYQGCQWPGGQLVTTRRRRVSKEEESGAQMCASVPRYVLYKHNVAARESDQLCGCWRQDAATLGSGRTSQARTHINWSPYLLEHDAGYLHAWFGACFSESAGCHRG
jgi:hypothetical protein